MCSHKYTCFLITVHPCSGYDQLICIIFCWHKPKGANSNMCKTWKNTALHLNRPRLCAKALRSTSNAQRDWHDVTDVGYRRTPCDAECENRLCVASSHPGSSLESRNSMKLVKKVQVGMRHSKFYRFWQQPSKQSRRSRKKLNRIAKWWASPGHSDGLTSRFPEPAEWMQFTTHNAMKCTAGWYQRHDTSSNILEDPFEKTL